MWIACDASPYACRRLRIAMRGSREVSLCSLGDAAERRHERRAWLSAPAPCLRARARRSGSAGSPARSATSIATVTASGRFEIDRAPTSAASRTLSCGSAASVLRSSTLPSDAGGARGIHAHLPGRDAGRSAAAPCAPLPDRGAPATPGRARAHATSRGLVSSVATSVDSSAAALSVAGHGWPS